MMGLVGQAGATMVEGKGYGSERGQNLMEILRRGLSLSPPLGCEEKAPTYKWPRMENLKWYAHRK